MPDQNQNDFDPTDATGFEFDYRPEKTLARFHASDAFVRGVMGPVGSGKSSAMCAEIVYRAYDRPPDKNRARRSRFAVVRNTYPELKSTTIKTWLDWLPETMCDLSGSGPFTARFKANCADQSVVDAGIIFLALDQPKDAKKLLSLELTGAWINEAREVPREVLDALTARVGRFPPKRDGGGEWSGIIMDTNPPDDEHWWYDLAEVNRPQGWEFFRQPPALIEAAGNFRPNPAAENAHNHPKGFDYWLRQLPGKSRQWINVYLLGRYGALHSGRTVYPEYDDTRHPAAEVLRPARGRPLMLGWDFGLTPACVLVQLTPRGCLNVIEEFVSTNMGIRQFAREVVKPRLMSAYAGYDIRGAADPAGRARSQTDERTCMDELISAGLPADPARSNDFTARREAVAGFLNTFRDGLPGFKLSPTCRHLRKGFLSGYRYERVQIAGEERYKDKPLKNEYSHVHDALQYAAMAVEQNVLRSRRPRRRNRSGYGDLHSGY